MKDKILQIVTTHYLESGDFNGISALELSAETGVEWSEMRDVLQELINEDLIGILYSEFEPNTHILRTGFPPKDIQISKLDTEDLFHTCLYPLPTHLQKVVDRSKYTNEPYKLYLALGEPQLAFRAFDLSVLEFYRNDPRYFYNNDDINGSISISDEYYKTHKMQERDQVLLQTFGFAYDDKMNRAVATFIRYLADLSPEHQQVWKTKELEGSYKLHPDYYRNNIVGDWGENVPIFSAFINELYIINQMALSMNRPPFFNKDFGEYGEDTPRKFSFLVRPTLEEFNNFVLLLDKLMSDNINKKFFKNEVSYETESERADGKIVVQQKGTIQILDEWVRKYFRFKDSELWDDGIKAMREVRKLRQKPAHAIDENIFDQKYFKEQRELMIRAYQSIRAIRLLFADHPSVKKAKIEVPEWLENGDIWTY